MGSRGRSWVGLLALAGACVAGCGQAHQDVHEPKGTFTVKLLKASFPTKQAIARTTKLKLVVRNTGTTAIPNLAVTIKSFGYLSNYPKLSYRLRPVWVVEQGPGPSPARPVQSVPFDSPGNYSTATPNTWATGAVPAGQSRTLVWSVTPVKAGQYTITYTIAGGLSGKAKVDFEGGRAPTGQFKVNIAPQPPITHVNPATGQVAAGALPLVP